MKAPQELITLRNWVLQNESDFSGNFELIMDDEDYDVKSWFGPKETPAIKKAAAAICPIGRGPDGSMIAVWEKNKNEKPIVFFGSEGDLEVLANNFFDFFRLLALGYSELGTSTDFSSAPKKSEGDHVDPGFKKWVQSLGLEIPKNGADIVSAAGARHADFVGWVEEARGKTQSASSSTLQAQASGVQISGDVSPGLFRDFLNCLDRRIDDPVVVELMKRVEAKPLKPTNPNNDRGYIAIKPIGVTSFEYSCAPDGIRKYWPARKEGKVYLNYVTRIFFEKGFTEELPFGLKIGSSEDDVKKVAVLEEKESKTKSYKINVAEGVDCRILIDKKNNIEKVILALQTERELISAFESGEKDSPYIYIEDGFFAAWLALRNLLNPEKYTSAVLAPLKDRKITPMEFLRGPCQRLIWSGDLRQDMVKKLTDYYYAFDADPNNFRSDIKAVFTTQNHFKNEGAKMTEDTWENFDLLAKQLDKRLKQFS